MNCGVKLLMMQRHPHACLKWMLFVEEFLVMVDVKWSCKFSLWVGIVWLYVSPESHGGRRNARCHGAGMALLLANALILNYHLNCVLGLAV